MICRILCPLFPNSSTMCPGVGRSGSPTPRLMTSTPLGHELSLGPVDFLEKIRGELLVFPPCQSFQIQPSKRNRGEDTAFHRCSVSAQRSASSAVLASPVKIHFFELKVGRAPLPAGHFKIDAQGLSAASSYLHRRGNTTSAAATRLDAMQPVPHCQGLAFDAALECANNHMMGILHMNEVGVAARRLEVFVKT